MAPLSDESRCHNSKKCRNDDVDACCVGDDDVNDDEDAGDDNDDDNDDDDGDNDDDNDDDDAGDGDDDDNDDDDAGDDNVANKFETITSERWLPRKGLSDDRHIKLPFSLSLSLSLSLFHSQYALLARTRTHSFFYSLYL